MLDKSVYVVDNFGVCFTTLFVNRHNDCVLTLFKQFLLDVNGPQNGLFHLLLELRSELRSVPADVLFFFKLFNDHLNLKGTRPGHF